MYKEIIEHLFVVSLHLKFQKINPSKNKKIQKINVFIGLLMLLLLLPTVKYYGFYYVDVDRCENDFYSLGTGRHNYWGGDQKKKVVITHSINSFP